MTTEEHARQALTFLAQSEREFEAGDVLQASEKLWGAATHALMAAEGRQGRAYPAKHKTRLRVLREHYPDLKDAFAVAEAFHSNFYHDWMEDYVIEERRPVVRSLVHKLLNGGGTG